MNLSRLTIGKKLGMGLGLSVVCLALLSFASLRVINTLGSSLNRAVNTTGQKLNLVSQTRQSFQEMKNGMLQDQMAHAIAAMEKHGASQAGCSACHTASPADERMRQLETSGNQVHDHSSKLRGLISGEKEKQALDALDQGASRWLEHSREYLRLANVGNFDEAHTILIDKIDPILTDAEAAAKALTEREDEALAAADKQARGDIARSRWMILVLAGLDLLVAAAVLWLVWNLTRTLRRAVNGLGQGAGRLTAAAGEVSGAGQTLAQGASEQAASIEETSASGKQIRSQAHGNTQRSRDASGLAGKARQHANETVTALDELENAMKSVERSSANISEVLGTIETIAFQTNILALNAAVEAARAGAAGQGFAVVADEVRRLAQRCAEAAQKTSKLIEESVQSSAQGRDRVGRVTILVRHAADRTEAIEKLVEGVAHSSEEQSRGIDEMTKALAQMSQVTQRNAATAEENAAAGEELTSLSTDVKRVVAQLGVMVDSRFSIRE